MIETVAFISFFHKPDSLDSMESRGEINQTHQATVCCASRLPYQTVRALHLDKDEYYLTLKHLVKPALLVPGNVATHIWTHMSRVMTYNLAVL